MATFIDPNDTIHGIFTPGVYIELFHGRATPDEQMDDWGEQGPIFGPLDFAHSTYNSDVKLQGLNHSWDGQLWFVDDMVFYDGAYYGDFSVFYAKSAEQLGIRRQVFRAEKAITNEKIAKADFHFRLCVADFDGEHEERACCFIAHKMTLPDGTEIEDFLIDSCHETIDYNQETEEFIAKWEEIAGRMNIQIVYQDGLDDLEKFYVDFLEGNLEFLEDDDETDEENEDDD